MQRYGFFLNYQTFSRKKCRFHETFLQRLISVKPQNENSLFIIYKGRVDAHKSFSSLPMAEKAPETRQCRYSKVSLLEGSFAEMCRERGDFGGNSYGETQRIGAGFAEMCNERGGALRKSLRDGICVFGENYWYCGEKSVSLRAEQITYQKL